MVSTRDRIHKFIKTELASKRELEIVIDLWKKLVIHEVIEYKFEDFVQLVTSQSRAVGGGIPMVNWANGVVFQFGGLPDTETIVQEKLKGTLHWSNVIFAVKEKFEKQIVREYGTVNLGDVSGNEIFSKLGELLRKQSKYIKTSG